MDIEKIEENTKSKIKYYKKINSTHIYAKEIERHGDNIVISEIQTSGIGTKGRVWYTGENKNIAMTIIKHPKCSVSELKNLTVKIAEVIRESIKELYCYDLQIKFPNDLMINGKKICGILTEVHTRGEKIEYLLISIGMNVNESYFSKELIDIATSLKKEFNKDFNREEIIIKIINKINAII